jgi:hypothetical protein
MNFPSLDPIINTALWIPRQVEGALTAGSVANARGALAENRRRLEVRSALEGSGRPSSHRPQHHGAA